MRTFSGTTNRSAMSMEFRQYEARDWEPLLDMYTSFEPKGVYMGLPPLRTGQIEMWLRGLLSDARNSHFVLRSGRQVTAHAAIIFYPNTPGSREIIIFVHQDHQGRGWGRKVFLGALNWACLRMGIDDVWLFVDWHNTRAWRLYASLGFTGRPSGLRESETLMRRPLHCEPCLRERCPVFTAAFGAAREAPG